MRQVKWSWCTESARQGAQRHADTSLLSFCRKVERKPGTAEPVLGWVLAWGKGAHGSPRTTFFERLQRRFQSRPSMTTRFRRHSNANFMNINPPFQTPFKTDETLGNAGPPFSPRLSPPPVFHLPPVSRSAIVSLKASANLRRVTVGLWLAE